MTAKTADGVKTQYKYNAGNQLTESITGAETTKYSYDKVGNLVKKDGAGGSVSYTYNALNLLSQWTDGTHTENYSYNASGLLSSVTTETSTTELVWDILNGDGQVLTATTDGEATSYTYGLERISAITGKARTEYIYDARGSVAAEVSKSGTISKTYTPFGEQLGEEVSDFGYNGEYYNAETKQVYLRARFYEPEMNRFSQKDIIRGSVNDGLSLNRYLYCANDPVNFVDSNGMARKSSSGSGGTLSSIGSAIKSAASTVVSTVKSAASSIGSAIKSVASSAATAVKNVVSKVSSWIDSRGKNNNDSTDTDTGGTDDGGTGIGYGGNYPSVTEDGTDLTDPSVQQSAAWDTPEVWVQTETGEYRCGSEIISYNGDGYKKAVDVINSALEAFKEQYKLLMEPYMPTLVIGAEVAAVEPGAFGEALLLVAATTISVYALFNAIKNDPNSMFKPIDLDDFDLPHLVTEPLPEEESDNIETLPTDEEKKGDDIETMPTDSEEKGNNTESLPLPEENKDLIVEAEETENSEEKSDKSSDNGKKDTSDKDHIVGENGTQYTSHSSKIKNMDGARIDSENPAPGKRAGQIHYQNVNSGEKYWYNHETQKFYSDDHMTELAPKHIQKLLEDPNVVKAIQNELKYLGELS